MEFVVVDVFLLHLSAMTVVFDAVVAFMSLHIKVGVVGSSDPSSAPTYLSLRTGWLADETHWSLKVIDFGGAFCVRCEEMNNATSFGRVELVA